MPCSKGCPETKPVPAEKNRRKAGFVFGARGEMIRACGARLELPTAWFVVFQPKRPILLFLLLNINNTCPIEFACLGCVPLFEVIWCNLLDS